MFFTKKMTLSPRADRLASAKREVAPIARLQTVQPRAADRPRSRREHRQMVHPSVWLQFEANTMIALDLHV
jgi:hypothetical protein